MNRLFALFLILIGSLQLAAPAAELTPQASRVTLTGRTLMEGDAAWFRDRIGAPPIATVEEVSSVDLVALGDSYTAGTGGQTPYPTLLRSLFKRGEFQNRGVGGDTSTMIRTRFDLIPQYWNLPYILWIGRNNLGDPTTVKADIAYIVSQLRSVQGANARFLILSILNAPGEGIGTANYATLIQLNADLGTIYGDRYLDIRTILVNSGTGTGQDAIDLAQDCTPTSLHLPAGDIHLTTAGYAIVANSVFSKWNTRYPVGTGAITMTTAAALISNPPDRQVPYWMNSANGIFAVSNTGARVSTNGSFTTVQNGDGFLFHGVLYSDGQGWLGGSAAANWWDRAFFKTFVQAPLFRPANGSGTNGAGVDLTLATGTSTGTGAAKSILLQTAPVTQSSGTTANALVTALEVDGDNTAENFRFLLYDVTSGTKKRVSRGAPDSGGTGYRVLRVPN
ncbi:MAG: hypothetical protein JWO82_2501 [Akkermansiaceae bacterium]|nr:hypothetical protein [Akkermansiaceae bacterium]